MTGNDVRDALRKHRTLMKLYEIEDFRVTEYPGKYVVRVGRKDRGQTEEVVVSKVLAEKYGSIPEYAKQLVSMAAMGWTQGPAIQKQQESDEGLAAGEFQV